MVWNVGKVGKIVKSNAAYFYLIYSYILLLSLVLYIFSPLGNLFVKLTSQNNSVINGNRFVISVSFPGTYSQYFQSEDSIVCN